ncbi:MAG: sulfotransferase family protein, partial [bacterium]
TSSIFDDPFFVLGAPRSGNTLLRIMLDRHPGVALPPESHFIPRLFSRRGRYGDSSRIEKKELFLRDLAADRWFPRWDLGIEAVREELAGLPRPTFRQAIEAPFRAYARREGKPRWGDKTPSYVQHLPLLAQLFPEARFVHIIRDGRDVALALLDRVHHLRGPATAAYIWRAHVSAGRAAAQSLAGRYMEVRYEDLVAGPEGTLKMICTFLALAFDPVMLAHDPVRVLQRIPAKERRLHGSLTLSPTPGLRDWRGQMSRTGLEEFEVVAGPTLTATGYQRATRPRLSARLRAWATVVLWSLGRRGRRALRPTGGRGRREAPV